MTTTTLAVSIHAPAWGATSPNSICACGLAFQSTPRMGGDARRIEMGREIMGFNPRPRMGGDRWRNGRNCFHEVSIHAPAWGATGVKK